MSADKTTSDVTLAVEEAISRFRKDIEDGKSWYVALLGAVKNWPVSQEKTGEQTYTYIIAEEALDILRIAERLLSSTHDIVCEEERIAFLFRDIAPQKTTQEETRLLMGETRYNQYLNYFYGVTVEDALFMAVEDEVRKEEQGLSTKKDSEISDEAFVRIYGAPQRILLQKFLKDKGYLSNRMTMEKLKEFSYWRFRYRLNNCEKARSASDTKKALEWLRRNKPQQSCMNTASLFDNSQGTGGKPIF